jgi:hypothetical protein
MGDSLSEQNNRWLVHFSDGGAGTREYAKPPEVGQETQDGRNRYRIVRVEPKQTRGGFGHAWAEIRPMADGAGG